MEGNKIPAGLDEKVVDECNLPAFITIKDMEKTPFENDVADLENSTNSDDMENIDTRMLSDPKSWSSQDTPPLNDWILGQDLCSVGVGDENSIGLPVNSNEPISSVCALPNRKYRPTRSKKFTNSNDRSCSSTQGFTQDKTRSKGNISKADRREYHKKRREDIKVERARLKSQVSNDKTVKEEQQKQIQTLECKNLMLETKNHALEIKNHALETKNHALEQELARQHQGTDSSVVKNNESWVDRTAVPGNETYNNMALFQLKLPLDRCKEITEAQVNSTTCDIYFKRNRRQYIECRETAKEMVPDSDRAEFEQTYPPFNEFLIETVRRSESLMHLYYPQ